MQPAISDTPAILLQTGAPRVPYTALALAILTIGVAFRLFFIADSNLWLDEIWTANADAAHRRFGDVLQTALDDQHPPLYDLLLHGWMRTAGDGPVEGRMLSLLFGAVGLWMTYAYTARIASSKVAGIFALSLLALNSFHAMHSIEMRYYALVYLLALGVVAHLSLFLCEESRAARNLFLFGAFALALLYTHVYGAFLLAAMGCAVLILAALRLVSRKRLWYFMGVAAALSALWAPFLLRVLAVPKFSGVAWMTLASPAVFFEYLYNYSNKNPVEAAAIGLPLVLSFLPYRKKPIVVVVLVASVVLAFLTGYLFSVLCQPMLHERYTMVYFPSLVLLAAVFWADVFCRKRFGLFTLGAAVAASAVINLSCINPFRTHLRHEPWKEMAIALSVAVSNGEPAFAEEPQYINYYTARRSYPKVLPATARGGEYFFWFVQTEYDREGLPGRDTLVELARQESSGRFSLIRFGRKN